MTIQHWQDFAWNDLIIAVVSSGLGGLFALWIAKVQNNQTAKDAEKAREESEKQLIMQIEKQAEKNKETERFLYFEKVKIDSLTDSIKCCNEIINTFDDYLEFIQTHSNTNKDIIRKLEKVQVDTAKDTQRNFLVILNTVEVFLKDLEEQVEEARAISARLLLITVDKNKKLTMDNNKYRDFMHLIVHIAEELGEERKNILLKSVPDELL